jgi:ribosomal protein S18 acetylase RimI-like enzyme
MTRLIHPLEDRSDFSKLTDLLIRCLNDEESFRFLSYSLIEFDKESIENMTTNHKENGIEYIISEVDDQFSGVLAYKKDRLHGFELYLLAVDREKRKKGIGQDLINECMKVASEESFRNVDSFVFADNKDMLRLLIKNDFRPVDIQFHARADGMDLIRMRRLTD